MKLTILQENLNKILSQIGRLTSNKTTLPILNNVLIEAEKGLLCRNIYRCRARGGFDSSFFDFFRSSGGSALIQPFHRLKIETSRNSNPREKGRTKKLKVIFQIFPVKSYHRYQ